MDGLFEGIVGGSLGVLLLNIKFLLLFIDIK